MCRIIVFSGTCSQCAGTFIWEDLSQELSCLESKNMGVFGQCRRGVQTEEHSFDQECDSCLAVLEADEGYGGMEEEEEILVAAKGKGKKSSADRIEDGRQHKKQRTS